MQNNTTFNTNFVPRGKFDKNVYRSPEIDPRTQAVEFLGNFKQNFEVADDKSINNMDNSGPFLHNYTLSPYPIQYSRQIYEPIFENKNPETNNIAHSDNFFKFGDPVFGAHGSNLNAPGSNQHKVPFNANSFLLGSQAPNLNNFKIEDVKQETIPKIETRNEKFSDINLLEDSVNKIFENITNLAMDGMIKKVENTHTNQIDNTYNKNNNFSQPARLTTEYEFSKEQFLERNVRGTKEAIYEYTIYINSADRDCDRYPNPFRYIVEFGASNKTTNAFIPKYFKNIKYMHLKSVVVPRRYAIRVKTTEMINNNEDETNTEFVNQCIATSVNSHICTFVKQQGIINYYGILYYFYFYSMQIDGSYYYMSTFSLFTDTEYRQSYDINRLSPDLGISDIQNWILNVYDPNDYVISRVPYILTTNSNISIYLSNNLPCVGSWILIANIPTYDITNENIIGGKIKFCMQNDRFDELIDQTYEFSYNLEDGPNLIDDTFKKYILLSISLEDDRYLLLNVPEIDTSTEYGTDDNLQRSFSILLPDYINGDYYYLDSTNHEKVFDNGTLGNISKMTISYKNALGNDIIVNNLRIIDKDITTPNNKCICVYDTETGERTRNYQCFHSYLRHPSFEKLQNTVILRLGVLEPLQDIQYF